MASLSKTMRALFLGVALVALMISCAGYVFLSEVRRPADSVAAPVEFVVEEGDATSTIATNLRTAGLIRQPLLFSMLVRAQGFDGRLQSGSYVLSPDMTMSQIIALMRTSQRAPGVTVSFAEGSRLEQIAERLALSNLPNVSAESFLGAARDGAAFKDRTALLSNLPPGASLEGYLFPDTYEFAATATVTDVIGTMLDRFDEQYRTFETEVLVPNVSVHQIVTMASIVQREAGSTDEMPRIAAVFWNRLKPEYRDETGGGRLQADPTVQYILGAPGEWWPKLDQLTVEQINGAGQNTPLAAYNTRVNTELPPGPISAPGLAALRAAARPDESQVFLYFVASCSQPGAHNFAATNEEFLRFQEEYLACPAR